MGSVEPRQDLVHLPRVHPGDRVPAETLLPQQSEHGHDVALILETARQMHIAERSLLVRQTERTSRRTGPETLRLPTERIRPALIASHDVLLTLSESP